MWLICEYMEKFFNRSLARSMCILVLAIFRHLSSSLVNWDLPLKNEGMFKLTPSGNNNWIVKPLSANTRYPGTKLSRILLCSTMATSAVEPGYALLQLIKAPFGATHVNT